MHLQRLSFSFEGERGIPHKRNFSSKLVCMGTLTTERRSLTGQLFASPLMYFKGEFACLNIRQWVSDPLGSDLLYWGYFVPSYEP